MVSSCFFDHVAFVILCAGSCNDSAATVPTTFDLINVKTRLGILYESSFLAKFEVSVSNHLEASCTANVMLEFISRVYDMQEGIRVVFQL